MERSDPRSSPPAMPRLVLGPLAALLVLTPAVVDAQLVRVGPLGGVSVRVPFVSVDTLPFGGGTRVRAPFVGVNTGLYGLGYRGTYGLGYRSIGGLGYRPPGYSYGVYGPRYPLPSWYGTGYGYRGLAAPRPSLVYPDPYALDAADHYRANADAIYRAARPDYDALRTPPISADAADTLRLRQSAARLERSLSRRPDDADVWLDYLRPRVIVDAIDGLNEDDSDFRLAALAANYEGVAGNPDLSDIWSADGFRRTHQGLIAYLQRRGLSPTTAAPPTDAAQPVDAATMNAPTFAPEPPRNAGGFDLPRGDRDDFGPSIRDPRDARDETPVPPPGIAAPPFDVNNPPPGLGPYVPPPMDTPPGDRGIEELPAPVHNL